MAQPNLPNTHYPTQSQGSETDGHPLQNGKHTTTQQNPENKKSDEDFFKEIRAGLMTVAILAAGATYQSGLNPPGGFWQDDNPHRNIEAGMPVLHDKHFFRYQTFFYCNAISFLVSLVIIIFLMTKDFFDAPRKIKTLKFAMVLNLFAFMAAYAAGSCRLVSTSLYVFLLMGLVFFIVILLAHNYRVVHKCNKFVSNCFGQQDRRPSA